MIYFLDVSVSTGLISALPLDSYRTPLSPALDTNRTNPGKTDPAERTIQADEILTVQEAADYLKIRKRAVYDLIADGQLKAKRINKWNFRILKSPLNRFMSR